MVEAAGKRLAVIGCGMFGLQQMEILWEAGALASTETILAFDDNGFKERHFHGIPVESRPFAAHTDLPIDAGTGFLVGLGYKHLALRRSLLEGLQARGAFLPVVRHPSAVVFSSAQVAPGAALYPGAILDQRAAVGLGTIVNNLACVSHDARVGACSFISGGTMIAGMCEVGAETFLGIGVLVANGVKIGERCRVAAGALVVKDMPNDRSGAGSPMVILPMQLPLA